MYFSQHVSTLVTAPLSDVEGRLQDVESWSAFLVDVQRITKVAHDRYDFSITSSGRVRQARVAVQAHARDHLFTWLTLGGPTYNGCLRLTSAPGDWTRARLALTAAPDGFIASLTDMLMPREQAAVDLQLLQGLMRTDSPPGGRIRRRTSRIGAGAATAHQ